MATCKVYSEREVKKILKDNGYVIQKKKGKGTHTVYYNVKKHDRIMFPKSFNHMLVRRELDQHNLIPKAQQF